jgi:phosphoribosyl-ATP pyrophosphohydrolase
MSDCIREVYETILDRKNTPSENSYTRYLFDQGVDKILKKVGEECAEVIISAKNNNNEDTAGEICDLAYHVLVLMAQQGITLDDVEGILNQRHGKAGNLKQFKSVDKNS